MPGPQFGRWPDVGSGSFATDGPILPAGSGPLRTESDRVAALRANDAECRYRKWNNFALAPKGLGVRCVIEGTLLRCAVVARGFLELLDISRRELGPIDFQRELVKLAGELERHLIII